MSTKKKWSNTPTNFVATSKCPKCNSLKRSEYGAIVTTAHAGILADGSAYDTVVRRRCSCLDCGQWRVDVSYENRGADTAAE